MSNTYEYLPPGLSIWHANRSWIHICLQNKVSPTASILQYIQESNDFGHSETPPHETLNMVKIGMEVRITPKIPITTFGSDLSVGLVQIDVPRSTEGPMPTQMKPLSWQAKKNLKRYESLFGKARRKKRACSFSGCIQNESAIIRYGLWNEASVDKLVVLIPSSFNTNGITCYNSLHQ